MDTLSFLRLIWPNQGIYLTAIPASYHDNNTGKQVNYYRHFAHETIEDAAQHAQALAFDREGGHNVYFALATVREDFTRTSKQDRDNRGVKVRGKHKSGHDNTLWLKAFWFDLDVKLGDDRCYPTIQDAWQGLIEFCTAVGLDQSNGLLPTVVQSGGGLHVYWPLDTLIEPEKWQHYADLLKRLSVRLKLKADPSRTADRASILRPAGTLNFKFSPPAQVAVVQAPGTVSLNTFLQVLSYKAETLGEPPVAARTPQISIQGNPPPLSGHAPVHSGAGSDLNKAAMEGIQGYAPADPKKVLQRCRQLNWQFHNQQHVDEPNWYAMIGAMRHAANGLDAVRRMSNRHPEYDESALLIKVQQLEDGGYGPTLCATFASRRPGGCDGCKYAGKITTPLQTVREFEAAPPPVMQLLTPQGTVRAVTLLPPPAGFVRVQNPATGRHWIAMEISTEAGPEQTKIYEHDLYPSAIVMDERTREYNVVVQQFLPQDGWRQFELGLGLLEKRKMMPALGANGVVVSMEHQDAMVRYMIGYIQDLQKAYKSQVTYAQLGWRLDGEQPKFILADRVITATGDPTNPIEEEMITPSKAIATALKWSPPQGTLEAWVDAMRVYDRDGMEAHQFAFGVGFASPLFKFTEYGGMMISLMGKSGGGKSSAAYSIDTLYGPKRMSWTNAKGDTLNAFYNKLGVLNNLAAVYDEHTNLDIKEISELAYRISQGEGRRRLKENGEARDNMNGWSLMMLTSGNLSLNSRLQMAKGDSAAESYRVFEYDVPLNTLTKAEADHIWGKVLSENYGHAGPAYIRALVSNLQAARDRVDYWIGEVDRLAMANSSERYWSAGVACVLTGFEIAKQIGLTPGVDIQRLLDFAVGVMRSMRSQVIEFTASPVGILSNFLNKHVNNVLRVHLPPNWKQGMTVSLPPDALPRGELVARHETHNNRMYIDRTVIRNFCASQHMDPSTVQKQLKKLGVLVGVDRIVMGRHTGLKTGQPHVWVINMNHPEMAGIDAMRDDPDEPTPASNKVVAMTRV